MYETGYELRVLKVESCYLLAEESITLNTSSMRVNSQDEIIAWPVMPSVGRSYLLIMSLAVSLNLQSSIKVLTR